MDTKRIEYLSPEAWTQWHTELLQSTVNRAFNRVPFYRKQMEAAGVSPEEIGSVADIVKLPFTTRDDLSSNYPYGLFSVPLRDIVRIHALRSGQINPIALGHTRADLKYRQDLTARFLASCSVDEDDIVQICLDPGMALHGQDIKEGAESLGALVIPPDPISARSQLRIMVDFKTTVLVTTPSYGLHLLDRLKELDIPIASLNLKAILFLGETLYSEDRMTFKEELDVETRAAYGIFEAAGPFMACECECNCGLHLALDHIIPEIVHPDTGQPMPDGEKGELVITTVRARANPLIRFRTGDITRIEKATCKCGRTTWRIDPIEGRVDDTVTVRGVKLSPSQIGNLLRRAAGTDVRFLIVLKRWKHLQQVEIMVAIDEALFTGSLPELHNWIRQVEELFLENLGIHCRINPVQPSSIEPFLKGGRKTIGWQEWTGQ